MIPLVLTEDNNGNVAIGMRQPSQTSFLKLVADAAATVYPPTGAGHVLFSSDTNFFVRYNNISATTLTSSVYASSTVSSGGSCLGTDPIELNPEFRTLTSVTYMSVIAPVAGNLTMSWFG